MTFDDELLMAYVDGELDEALRSQVEHALADSPVLAARVSAQRALRQRLSVAMDAQLSEPVPDRLLQAARTAPAGLAVVKELGARQPPLGHRWPQFHAVAASVAIAAIGTALWLRWLDSDVPALQAGRVALRSELSLALSQQLSGNTASGAAVQLGITFRDGNGNYCRTFTVHSGQETAGLACQEAGGWSVAAIAPMTERPQANGGLRMAAGTLPSLIAQAVDARISGEALDADAERQARDRGWHD